MQIARKPLLRIFASADGSGIRLKARGPAAPLAKPVMDRINKIFADEKPIRSGPDKFIFSTWIPPAPSDAFDRMLSAQVGAMIRRPVPDQFSIAVMKACPNDCIHGTLREVHLIDQEKCIKCGACYEACRFEAVETQRDEAIVIMEGAR